MIIRLLLCGVTASATCACTGAQTTKDTALQVFRDAYSSPFGYSASVDWPVLNLDPKAVISLKAQPGYWNATQSYFDPESRNDLWITAVGIVVVNNDGEVREERNNLVGPPEFQRSFIELVGRERWVPPFPSGATETSVMRYRFLAPEEARTARLLGRTPHRDMWASKAIGPLAHCLVEYFESGDTRVSADGDGYVLESPRHSVSAWIDGRGSLLAAQLPNPNGGSRRIQLSGVLIARFFPAPFPREVRTLEIAAGETVPKVTEIAVFREADRSIESFSDGFDLAVMGVREIGSASEIPTDAKTLSETAEPISPGSRSKEWLLAFGVVSVAGLGAWLLLYFLRRRQSLAGTVRS